MKVGIVGLGLIGASLGLDLRRLGYGVVGVARRQDTCRQAVAAGVVDSGSTDFEGLKAVDCVFVCTPIAATAPTVAAIAPYLSPQTVVTDVGSVKQAVVQAASHHWPRFVGGHPMAGKTEAGLAAAEPGLFAGRAYVITPLDQTPEDAVAQVAAIATDLKAEVHHCSPEAHDRAVAWISHLPVMISSSLIQACLSEPDQAVATLAQQFASSGFRDTSRVGGGNPELGLMMARYNRAEVLRSLHHYRQQLDRLTTLVTDEDWDSLSHWLQCTQQARPHFVVPEVAPDVSPQVAPPEAKS